MMAGTPASGKSTYAKKHKKENDIYISRDLVRFSILKPGEAYFSKETTVYNIFVQIINRALQVSSIDTVWIDATHLNINSRKKLLRRINQPYSCLEIICMETPLQECLNRNNKRTGVTKVPAPQVKKMYESYQRPTFSEGFDKITIINADNQEIVYKRGE